MDIEITNAGGVSEFTVIERELTEDGVTRTNLERMPREILAIRAAEYDLAPDDDFVLDLVLLERFAPVELGPGDVHPLYSAHSVAEALETMHVWIEAARDRHGAPKGKNRLLAAAIRNGAASTGLVKAQHRFQEHADIRVMDQIRYARDAERERVQGS